MKGFPEKALVGRMQYELDWFFKYLLFDETAIDARDRAVYVAAYNTAEAIRVGDA